MKLATGLRMPSRGSIAVDGKPIVGPLKVTGMAFQASSLLPWRTTLDNVLLPLEIVEPHRTNFRRERPAFAAKARRLLASVGLDGHADQFPWELAGGMQQRPRSVAPSSTSRRCSCSTNRSARSTRSREELWCILRDLHAAQRFNVILVTHDLREAVFLADTVS